MAFCQGCGAPLGSLGTLKGGRYTVVRVLGQGGIGRTCLVVDRVTGQRRATKELLATVAGQLKLQELFTREAIALKSLEHPKIPSLLDFFVEGTRKVQVMEAVFGCSLERMAARAGGRLPEQQVVALMEELCEILDYIHGQGVIHRDIKPSNLLWRFSPPGLVLIDFGAVREIGAPPGTRIATAGFSAPEQSQGMPAPQSDLFAVGVTIISLITGKPPAMLYDATKGAFTQLEQNGISRPLAKVVHRVTAVPIPDRQASARELLLDLRSIGAPHSRRSKE